jgi:hypothetical protein
MPKNEAKSKPKCPDTPCRCGGRRPSSCSAPLKETKRHRFQFFEVTNGMVMAATCLCGVRWKTNWNPHWEREPNAIAQTPPDSGTKNL